MGLFSIYMDSLVSVLFYSMFESISDCGMYLIAKLSHFGTYTQSIDQNLSIEYDIRSDAVLSIETLFSCKAILIFELIRENSIRSMSIARWIIEASFFPLLIYSYLLLYLFPSTLQRFTSYWSKRHIHCCLSRQSNSLYHHAIYRNEFILINQWFTSRILLSSLSNLSSQLRTECQSSSFLAHFTFMHQWDTN